MAIIRADGISVVWHLTKGLLRRHFEGMAQELTKHGLEPADELFVWHYARLGSRDQAAEAAGITVKHARQLVQDPHAQAAIEAETRAAMQEAAPKAIRRLKYLMDYADSDGTKLQAAKDLLDRSGYKPEHNFRSADAAAGSRDTDAIMRRIKELQSQLGVGEVELAEVRDVESSSEAETPALPPSEDAPDGEGDQEQPQQKRTVEDLLDTLTPEQAKELLSDE
jgi:hypothetical protein